jgi:hypothetical protein
VESLRKTSANVEAISATLRNEVAELSRSVGHLSDRLTQASDRMEERTEDFNALMEVMQEEAEGAFVDTAATARGVRRGIGALQQDRNSRGRLRGDRGERRQVGDRRGPVEAHAEDGTGDRDTSMPPPSPGETVGPTPGPTPGTTPGTTPDTRTPVAGPGPHPFVDTELS